MPRQSSEHFMTRQSSKKGLGKQVTRSQEPRRKSNLRAKIDLGGSFKHDPYGNYSRQKVPPVPLINNKVQSRFDGASKIKLITQSGQIVAPKRKIIH